MLGNTHFYNRTIRKLVVSFGSIFNDIEVRRYKQDGSTPSKERFKVPLVYGPKEKYLTLITSDPTNTKSIGVLVPRISFSLDGLAYDMSRKQMSTMQNFSYTDAEGLKTQFLPIPYNFDFSVSIYVRNTEDGTQILEQILPFFTPDFTVTVNLNPEMNQKYDVPIILNSVSTAIDYEGDTSTTRLIVWDLSFTVKGFIFPPVKGGLDEDGEGNGTGINGRRGVIRRANANIYLSSTDAQSAQKVYVDSANGFGVFATGEVVRASNRDLIGKVSYFSNNATGMLVVEDLTDFLRAGDILVGDYTNAKYTISTVDLTPYRTVSIVVEPDPITANVDDDYGYTETIVEY